jgi:hypothetical protein
MKISFARGQRYSIISNWQALSISFCFADRISAFPLIYGRYLLKMRGIFLRRTKSERKTPFDSGAESGSPSHHRELGAADRFPCRAGDG